MSQCPTCGCQVESPFDGKTVIHDTTRCGATTLALNNVSASAIRPFDAVAQMLADLMKERGFRVARGSYKHLNGDTLPTWVIDRPDTPEWCGAWFPWEANLQSCEDGEAQTLLNLCGRAIAEWEEIAWEYDRLTGPKKAVMSDAKPPITPPAIAI